MERAGVLTSVNSDSDELARRLNLDAAKAIKYGGLTEEGSAQLCTLNPATNSGVDKPIVDRPIRRSRLRRRIGACTA